LESQAGFLILDNNCFMKKPLLRELAWLLLAVVITLVLTFIVFDWESPSPGTILISLHDTYFVVSIEVFLIPLLSFVCFLLFLIKEIRHRFSRIIPSMIIIASGILLATMLTMTTKFFPVIGGYTIYPPLSTLGDHGTQLHYGWEEEKNLLANIIITIQAIVIITIAYTAYRLGVSKIKKV
jgi:hypothetical protein